MSRDIYELLEKMIDKKVKGADTYINHSSRWLIFTDEKKWIFELTKTGTLWYNYYFFEKIFKIISLDVVENQHHITKWVENFIQNGVKRTQGGYTPESLLVGDTIQNGVIYTVADESAQHLEVGDTIQNGVIYTWGDVDLRRPTVEDTIQNGIKHTEYGDWLDGDERLDDIIENGVKETKQEEHHRLREVVQTIKNGFKETNPHFLEIPNPINFEPTIKEMKRMNEVNIVLEGYQRGKRTS